MMSNSSKLRRLLYILEEGIAEMGEIQFRKMIDLTNLNPKDLPIVRKSCSIFRGVKIPQYLFDTEYHKFREFFSNCLNCNKPIELDYYFFKFDFLTRKKFWKVLLILTDHTLYHNFKIKMGILCCKCFESVFEQDEKYIID